MAIQYGVNITASDMADMVQSSKDAAGKKSWEMLYGNAGLNYQSQSDALLKTYGDTIAEAYKSSLQQQNALYDLGLSAGDTADLKTMAREDLMATYQNYLSNYQQAQSDLAASYQEQKGLYDEALMTESENFANLYNSAMDYYEKVLKGATYTQDDLSKPIYEGSGKEAVATGNYEQKTSSLVDDYGLQWLMKADESGNLTALDRNELMNKMFDASGSITEYGRNFYDMVFNHSMTGQGYTDTEGNPIVTFDEWLSGNNNDLYNWLHSTDTFNYTHQGTKLGTAKTFVGLDSTDETFMQNQTYEGMIGSLDKIITDNRAENDYTVGLSDIHFLNDLENNYNKLSDSYHENLYNNYYKLEETREAYNNEQKLLYDETLSTLGKLLDSNTYDEVKKKIDDLYKEYGLANWSLSSEELESVSNYGPANKRKHFGQEKTIKYNNAMKDMYNKLTSSKFKDELYNLLKDVYSNI